MKEPRYYFFFCILISLFFIDKNNKKLFKILHKFFIIFSIVLISVFKVEDIKISKMVILIIENKSEKFKKKMERFQTSITEFLDL